MNTPSKRPPMALHTLDEWRALPADSRVEFIDGEFIQKAAPSFAHGVAQLRTGGALTGPFGRSGGGPLGPGGWWIGSEIDLVLEGRGYRPDLAGWKRERLPAMPKTGPIELRPDWICEILSESNRGVDTVKKVRRYHQAGVPHYWVIDQPNRSLTVYRHSPDGYVVALVAEADERVRAEPFDAIELSVAELMGDDPEQP